MPDPASNRREPLWVLLPLRLFLGATFLYAGLSKIAQRSFLDDNAPGSMHAAVVGVRSISPIGGLLGPVVDHSFAFGLLMATAETAVGIGTLLGLLSRIAGLGGMALSLSLFLTVSWGADPWYTGADLGYFVAFSPLVLAGVTPLSADAWLAAAQAAHPGTAGGRTRRGVLAAAAAMTGLVAIGAASLLRSNGARSRAAEGPPGSGPAAGSGSAAPGSAGSGTELIAVADVPVGGGREATSPDTGDQVWVLQLEADRFTALDARCPHEGCAVAFVSKSVGFTCPCHGSTFDSGGAVTRGPASSGLTKVAVTRNGDQVTLG